MDKNELIRKLESMKGLAGSGAVLGETIKKVTDFFGTLEPGDIARTSDGLVSAAPIAYDVWYLAFHQNFLRKYHEDIEGVDFNHYNYSDYLSSALSFLNYLPGIKPLKVLTDLKEQLNVDPGYLSVFGFDVIIPSQYENNGIYWINTLFFELRRENSSFEYSSEGSDGFKRNPSDYVGYIAFPIGQLGVMEVISLVQETDLAGYSFAAYSSMSSYHQKQGITNLKEEYKPQTQSPPEMFPDAKDNYGNALAGQNYCFGRHLIESAYYMPEKSVDSQNHLNSEDETAYAPVACRDVELWADNIRNYGEDITPKKWMRYWIHKDSTLPVPGEFIGILARPVAIPPHVWWFQESSPFVYAGNWMETYNLTSGIVTKVDYVDEYIGNQYTVAIQGCPVKIESSDFLEYSVGDRVAVLKADSLTPDTKAFSSLDQVTLKSKDKETVKGNFIIIPATFYKIKN